MGRGRRGSAATCMVALLVGVATAGCFDYAQDIWINEDRTARVRMDFGISESLVLMAEEGEEDPLEELRANQERAQRELEAHPYVQRCTLEEYTDAGFRRMVLELEIPDARLLLDDEFTTLLSRYSVFSQQDDGGTATSRWRMRFEERPGGRIAFVQSIALQGDSKASPFGKPPTDAPFDQMREAMGRAMFGNNVIRITLHAPAVSATNGSVTAAQDSVTWSLPLMTLIQGGKLERELQAEFDMPRDWTPWIVGGILAWIVLMAVLVAVITRMRRSLRIDPSRG